MSQSGARRIDCYFDFVSPWSYLAIERLHELPADVELTLHPVLFAGLLQHWGHLGPAEIPAKRLFTLRNVQWIAAGRGVPLTFPPEFPFNPVPLLRLAIAAGAAPAAVQRIFRYVWREGRLPGTPGEMRELRAAIGLGQAEPAIDDPDVKRRLRENSVRAIEHGVFGVPTFLVNGELFWGDDGMSFLLGYLDEPALLDTPQMKRLAQIPALERRRG